MQPGNALIRHSRPTSARSVDRMSWTASIGTPSSAIDSLTTSTKAVLECIVSLPPRRITALPDLIQRVDMSIVILGLLS